MAKLSLLAGSVSKTVKIFVQDGSLTTGLGLTGLVFNTASLVASYALEGAASAVVITLVTATLGTWTSGGFIVVDAANMPGMYELDLPNAALTGAKSVVVMLKGAANMVPVVLEIELTAVDNQSATSFVTSVASVVGSVGSVTGAVGSVTGAVGSLTGTVALSAIGLDNVLMSDVAAVPGITATLKSALNWLFILARNRRTQTSTTETVFKDDGATAVGTSVKSDDATTFTRGKYS